MPELVVVFNARLSLADEWRAGDQVPDDLIVLADPEAELYESLGTRRAGPFSLLTRAVPGAIRSALEGRVPHRTSADMLRLGADVAVRGDGTIALLHLAETADDRLAPARMAAALSSR